MNWVTVKESKDVLSLDASSPFEPGKAVIKEMKNSAKILMIRLSMTADGRQLAQLPIGYKTENKFSMWRKLCKK